MRRTLCRYAGALALAAGCEANDVQVLGVAPAYRRDAGPPPDGAPAYAEPTDAPPAHEVCTASGDRVWQLEPLHTLVDSLPTPPGSLPDGVGGPNLTVDTDGTLWLLADPNDGRALPWVIHLAVDGTVLGVRNERAEEDLVKGRVVSHGHLYSYELLPVSGGDDDARTRAVLRVYDGALEQVAGPVIAPGFGITGGAAWSTRVVRLAADEEGIVFLRFEDFAADFTVFDAQLRVVDGWSARLSGYPEAFDRVSVLGRTPAGASDSEVSLDSFSLSQERLLGFTLGIASSGEAYDDLTMHRDAEGRIVTSGRVARTDAAYPAPDVVRCLGASTCDDPWLWVTRLAPVAQPEYVWRIHAYRARPAVHPDGRVFVPSITYTDAGTTHSLAEIDADGAVCTRSALPSWLTALAAAPDGSLYYATISEIGRLVEVVP